MAVKGITKRWLLSSFSLMLVVLIVLAMFASFFIRGYCYNNIQRVINERSNRFVESLDPDDISSSANFEEKVREYVQNFSEKDLMELVAFNSKDEIIIKSTGFLPLEKEEMPDYNIAKLLSNSYGTWTGKIKSNEKVIAVTKCLYTESGEYLGAIRYVVSLEPTAKLIVLSIIILSIIEILLMIFIIISSSYFMKSIVDPLYDIGNTAKKIAQGDFNVRIEGKYNDEIGELCDIINYMASDLGESEKLKNDFISSVSHELRTPLTAIKGWAETMQMGESIDEQTMNKGLKIIVNESERLSGIVEELLDFSKMQSGRMVLMMDKIDLLAEVDEAVYMFKERAQNEKKELIYDAPATISPVLGDKNRLRQVFINIIDNAIKYSPEGSQILVKVVEDDNIKVSIADEGCGIPLEHLPKVKEKFYKANKTQRGSGIGLAVANEIVTLHSGNLDISSEEGIGTVVTITLPKIEDKL